jgi:PAS domain S-box-containing protein/putative nucleotidyltransferase with HDIG domain
VLRGESGTLQFEVIGLKGTHRWLDAHSVPLYDERGNVTSLLGLTRDITDRMRAAEAVREAEEKYRSIFENAVEGIYQSTPDGRFYTVNPAFSIMMGYDSPQEMMDAVTDIARQLYSETDRRQDFIQQLDEHGSISGFEYQMRRKDGRLMWVSENARLVRDFDGQVLYYEGFLEDITSRKHNEQRIDNQLKQLNALHAIDNAINSNFDLRTTLEVLLREVVSQLKADAASVLLFNKDTHTLDYTAGRGFLSKATQHTKLSAGEGYAGRVILDRQMIHIPDLTKTENNRLTDALNLAGENFAAYVGSPLIAKGQVVGVLEIFQRAPLAPDLDWFDFLAMLADQAAIAIDNAQLFENLQRSNFELTLAYDATIEGWSRALDLRDRETEGHTQRVTNLTVKLSRQMGIPDPEILHIRRGALLHDIGKMGIPDNILHKPDQLTSEEWEIMRQHTNYAYQMLTPIKYLKQALDIPRYHHEKWDGTGYPNGLKGEQIPIAARIFAVVDVWDALTSDRSYRDAWTKEKAIEYIRAEAGKHFDPKVVETFLTFILNESL